MTRLLLPLILAAALGACGGNGGQRKDDAPVVVSAIGPAPEAADPSAGALDLPQRVLIGATAQGLVRFDGAGQVEPGLAERWIVIDDGRSYIFRLREAQWRDGEPVTAAQVVRALRRAIARRSRNALAPYLAAIDEVVEMTPQVIEVRLKSPRPDLLKLFAQPELAITRAKDLVGSGPFLLTAARNGALLRPASDPLASPDDAGPAPEDMVRLRGERAAAAIARFRAGESDLVLGGRFGDWPIVGVAGIAPANIRIDPASGLFGLAVVGREGFLADPANRAALAMAIDRPALLRAIHADWAPVETLLPGQHDSAAPPALPAWAPLALDARRLAARGAVAAWRRTHEAPIVVRIALPAGPGATLVWAHLAASMMAIGVEPRRVAIDADADLRLIDKVAPYDSARWFLAEACAACSDAAKALVIAARDAPDLATRAQRIAEADAAVTAEAAYIPIAQPFRWSIVAMRLQAWQRNALAWHPLNHLRNDTE